MKLSNLLVLMIISSSAIAGNNVTVSARVLGSEPIFERVNVPRQECTTSYVREYERDRQFDNDGMGGKILGGLVGGALGSQIGKGNGRLVGATIGATTGAIIGGNMATDDSFNERRYHERPVEHCTTRYETEERIRGYIVRYEVMGNVFTGSTRERPGEYVEVSIEPRLVTR